MSCGLKFDGSYLECPANLSARPVRTGVRGLEFARTGR